MRTHIHVHCSGRRIWLTFHGRFSCALAAAGGTVSTPILIFCATGVVGHRCCRHQPMQNVGTASVNGRTSSMKPRPLSRGLLGWSKRRRQNTKSVMWALAGCSPGLQPSSHAAKALDLARRAALGFWSDARWRYPGAAQAASYRALCLSKLCHMPQLEQRGLDRRVGEVRELTKD